MSECLFCAIASKRVDAVIVWEDSEIMAFLDWKPIREGHCQIIPKQHVETFEQMSPALAAKVLGLGQRLAQRMKVIYSVDRVAFLFTGSDVPHAHAHVIPMHEKTDITSARYILNPEAVEFRSLHLQTDQDSLVRVKAKLQLD